MKMIKSIGHLILAIVIFISFSFSAYAASYIKFEGIDGEAEDKGHEDWIEVLSIEEIKLTHRDAPSQIQVKLYLDKASPKLVQAFKDKKLFSFVKIDSETKKLNLKKVKIISIKDDFDSKSKRKIKVVILEEENIFDIPARIPGTSTKKKR